MSIRNAVNAARIKTRESVHEAFSRPAYIAASVPGFNPVTGGSREWNGAYVRVFWARRSQARDNDIGNEGPGVSSVVFDAPMVALRVADVPQTVERNSEIYVSFAAGELYILPSVPLTPSRGGFVTYRARRATPQELAGRLRDAPVMIGNE